MYLFPSVLSFRFFLMLWLCFHFIMKSVFAPKCIGSNAFPWSFKERNTISIYYGLRHEVVKCQDDAILEASETRGHHGAVK